MFSGRISRSLCAAVALVTAAMLAGVPAMAQDTTKPGEKLRAEQVLPDETLFYIALEDLSASIERLKASALGRIHNEPDVNPLTSILIEQIRKGIRKIERRTKLKLDDFKKAFKGQATVAVVGMVDNPFDGQMLPQIVVVAEVRDGREAMENLVRDLTDRFQALVPQLETTTYEFEGTPVTALGVGELKICHAYARGLFIGALTESAMDRVLTNLGRSKGKTLTEHPGIIPCRRKTAKADLLTYVNVEKLIEALREYRKIDFDGERVLQILGLDKARSAAFGAGLAGGGVKDALTVDAPARSGVLRLLSSSRARMPAKKFVPESAVAVVAARIEPGRLYREVLSVIGLAEGPARVDQIGKVLEAATAAMGIDLDKQLFGGLTGEIMLYVDAPPQGGLIPDGVVLAQLSEGSKFPELFNLLRPLAFRNATFESFDYHGTEIHFGRLRDKKSPILPTYAIRDGQFIFATNTQTMQRLIRRMDAIAAGDTVRSIVDKADFRQVTAKVSKNASLMVYADAKLLFNRIYGTGVHFLLNRRPNRRLGLEPNRLPNPETISKHLFGFAMALSSDDKGGLTLEGYSPAGGLSILPALGAVLGTGKAMRVTTVRAIEPDRAEPAQPEPAPEGADEIF